MIEINVSQQLKESIGSTRSYKMSDNVDVAGSKCMVQGEIKLIRTDKGILIKGRLNTELEVTCSRCLNLFSCPLTLDIEEEFSPTTDIVSGAVLPFPEEPGSFTINEHHVLDLREAVRQYALLALPMKPLCREDCAGLCSRCGHNLNQGPCNCQHQIVDPRWSKLKELALIKNSTVNNRKGIE